MTPNWPGTRPTRVNGAAAGRAAVPEPGAKQATWDTITSGTVPNAMFRAVLSGFAHPDQPDLLPHRTRPTAATSAPRRRLAHRQMVLARRDALSSVLQGSRNIRWSTPRGRQCRCRTRRNSATPWLASEPKKPYPFGPVMPQPENAMGIDPATCSAEPLRRPEIVTVTRCEIPRMVSWPVAVAVMVAPEANAEPRVTGWVRVNVATGYCRVPRLVANCGCVFPPTVMAVRPMRNAAAVTFGPETAMVPVTACVRPTVSLLIPRAVSWTRKPATEPAATSHVPARGPAGAPAPAVGSTSGERVGWSLMNAPTARTTRTTSTPRPARIHRSQ